MYRVLVVAFLLFSFGCEAPLTQNKQTAPYVVGSSVVNPANNSLLVNITLNPPVTEESAKAATQAVINENRDKFASISVQAFTSLQQQGGTPYVVSIFSNGAISHQVNKQLEPQKIPTH